MSRPSNAGRDAGWQRGRFASAGVGAGATLDPLGDAVSWKRKNPEAYRALVLWAKEDVENGVRPSMDAYGHLLWRPHMAGRLGLARRSGDPVLFNDHLTSSLAGAPAAARARNPVPDPSGPRRQLAGAEPVQLIVGILVPLLAAAVGLLLAVALACGTREHACRADFRAGLRAATLALGQIADSLAKPEREAPGREPRH